MLSKKKKKGLYNKLDANVNAIDTSKFVLRTQYRNDKLGIDKKLMTLIKNT